MVLDVLANAVVLAQIMVPLVVGYFEWKRPAPHERRSGKKGRIPFPEQPAARRNLEPLRCSHCGAPVPLIAKSFPCPACGRHIRPAAAYAAALRDRAAAIRELELAERLWRRSRWMSSLWFVWLLRVVLLVVTIGVFVACYHSVDAGMPGVLAGFAALIALVQFILWLPLTYVLRELRPMVPPVPERRFLRPKAEAITCRHCGAPAWFEEGRFSTTCAYCGGDSYRAALAEKARAEAKASRSVAQASLRSAVAAWRERRHELGAPLAILAAGEIFFGVGVIIAAIGSLLGF